MGFSETAQVEGSFESDTKKWVIAGIALRAPLKPIYTIPVDKEQQQQEEVEAEEECCTTPTSVESRIPTTLTCPPAPRKPKPSPKFNFKEFFTPPDLETVFMRHAEKAN